MRFVFVFVWFVLCNGVCGVRKEERSSKTKQHQPQHHHSVVEQQHAAEESIEDVDEDKIDEILRDGTTYLVVLFYDSKGRCAGCAEALSEMEEIDDDLEAVGYIEVVKSDDRNVAKELGIKTFPSLVYFRRRNPILYDGDFKDSEVILRWLRAHEEVATVHLEDDDFEDHTDSASPVDGALDWMVMFYNSKDEECNSFIAVWEAVAHKLRGLVQVGKLDIFESDDVAERFKIDDDDDCPTFILFHRGKMYRYKESAKDVKSFTSFALHKFKEQRGHRVPDPPTFIEEFYEEVKEETARFLQENRAMSIAIGGCSLLIFVIVGIYKLVISFRKEKSS